jgi:hypothetical protein
MHVDFITNLFPEKKQGNENQTRSMFIELSSNEMKRKGRDDRNLQGYPPKKLSG